MATENQEEVDNSTDDEALPRTAVTTKGNGKQLDEADRNRDKQRDSRDHRKPAPPARETESEETRKRHGWPTTTTEEAIITHLCQLLMCGGWQTEHFRPPVFTGSKGDDGTRNISCTAETFHVLRKHFMYCGSTTARSIAVAR